jgi:hypothetical protein
VTLAFLAQTAAEQREMLANIEYMMEYMYRLMTRFKMDAGLYAAGRDRRWEEEEEVEEEEEGEEEVEEDVLVEVGEEGEEEE